MQASNRIIVNTLAQYIRTIINMVLTLYSSRLVLDILGVEDYGIYSLVAGIVSMLSFLTNSLVGSTQRFLSIHQGKGNVDKLKEVFSNSLLLHILLGVGITFVLALLTPVLFNGFLNIPAGRENIAQSLYLLVIVMVYISFVTSPFRALLVSRENIVYASVVDVIDGVLKVLLVLLLPYITFDKLYMYGWIMVFIQLFNLFAFSIYSFTHYVECIFPKFKYLNLNFVKEMFAFTGWITYSSVSVTLKMQGLAIVFNKFFGTAMNAAYGIGSQIAGMVSFVSTSFNNAIAPQLMAAEGGGDRARMWTLAEVQSKCSFLLLAMLGIPVMFEMQTLLELWLVDVPDYTVLFGCMFLATQIVDMLSAGLGMANRAIGNIGYYTFMTFTPKLFVLPLAWLALKYGLPLYVAAVIMFGVEAFCMLLRIWLFRNEKGFHAKKFCQKVIIRSLPPTAVSIVCCSFVCGAFDFKGRFLITFPMAVLLFVFMAYWFSFSTEERQKINAIVLKIFNFAR